APWRCPGGGAGGVAGRPLQRLGNGHPGGRGGLRRAAGGDAVRAAARSGGAGTPPRRAGDEGAGAGHRRLGSAAETVGRPGGGPRRGTARGGSLPRPAGGRRGGAEHRGGRCPRGGGGGRGGVAVEPRVREPRAGGAGPVRCSAGARCRPGLDAGAGPRRAAAPTGRDPPPAEGRRRARGDSADRTCRSSCGVVSRRPRGDPTRRRADRPRPRGGPPPAPAPTPPPPSLADPPPPVLAEQKPPPRPSRPRENEQFEFVGGRTRFTLPPIDVLNFDRPERSALDKEAFFTTAEKLRAKLADFGIVGEVVEIRPGPVVTMYEFLPGPGIKVSKIASLADD